MVLTYLEGWGPVGLGARYPWVGWVGFQKPITGLCLSQNGVYDMYAILCVHIKRT